ncbi:MAG: type II toxin-antitoxin system HicB family antitoxin [Oscillospiraceae bacterium]|nr:type II toxin-antitoxin system HicB family antitoxin [Oscillospiraceae bacterium]
MKSTMSYKDYHGSVELSEEDGVFHGKVVGIKSLLSFEGDSVVSLTEDFHNAVNEYLEFCADSGFEPEKPNSRNQKYITANHQ